MLETLRDINFPNILPEQAKIITKKASKFHPLAGVNFLEQYIDKSIQKEWNIPSESVYSYFESCLEDLKERDLVLGFRKTYMEKEKDKNMLTMLQLRDYHGAEELMDDTLIKSHILEPSHETLKGYIEKHIYEEAWIEIQKNFNDWGTLYEVAKETQRKDLLIEAAYYTQNLDVMEQLLKQNIDEESSIDNYMSYVYCLLINDNRTEPFGRDGVMKFKEAIYLRLMFKWFHLPKVFCESYIIQVNRACLWNEFEEGFDIILEFMTQKKQQPETRALQHLSKFKDEVTQSYYYIFRQRLPNEADGLLNAKKLLEQRSLISHYLHSMLKNFLESQVRTITSAYNFSDSKKYNIYNESVHNTIMYCKIERSFNIYNSVMNVSKDVDKMIDDGMMASQVDEYFYYYELVKLWEADDDQKDPPERVIRRLTVPTSFKTELRSSLHALLMEGYIEKNMLEKANEHGVEAIKLYENNWSIWTVWFHFYKKLYQQCMNTDKNMVYLKEMIKLFTKVSKYQHQNYLLFNEILNALYFRDDMIKLKYNSDESMKNEVAAAFKALINETPVWTWTVWLGNLILNVYKKKNSLNLDEIIISAIKLSGQCYKSYTHHVLNSILNTASEKDPRYKELEDELDVMKYNPLINLKFQDSPMIKLYNILDSKDIKDKNHHQETIRMIYSYREIESKQVTQINARCRDIGGESFNRLKNIDSSQRLHEVITIIESYLTSEKHLINKKPKVHMNEIPLGAKINVLNPTNLYNERNLTEFYSEAFLLPEIKVIYEARTFGIQVELMTSKHVKLVYTLKKSQINPVHLMSYNHYKKILNTELTVNNETVNRMLKFEATDMMFLEDQFFMKSKPRSEVYLIDMLDEEMENIGLSVDYSIEHFASKKSIQEASKRGIQEVNKHMMDRVKNPVLKREVLRKLKSQYEIFLWKKRYAQSLGVNMISSLLFVKGRLE